MRNIMLTVSYDGTAYHGFQYQSNGLVTIQSSLEQALEKVTGERIRVIGAGRTDAGVHALGQVCNVRTNTSIPIERLPYAINSALPRDIVVLRATEVPLDFHARFSATRKTYRYSIDNHPFRDVFRRNYAYHVPEPLDVTAMATAAEQLLGRHDFAAFRATGSSTVSTVRTITDISVVSAGGIIDITVSADGFLYNMVRIIVGTLLEIGRNRRTVDHILRALETGEREAAGPTVPAYGLCLVRVEYNGAVI